MIVRTRHVLLGAGLLTIVTLDGEEPIGVFTADRDGRQHVVRVVDSDELDHSVPRGWRPKHGPR